MLSFFQEQETLYFLGFSFVFIVAVWGLNRLQRSLPSPVNRLIVRWVRLVITGIMVALLLKISVFETVPFWRLYVIGVLGWMLVDSIYLWLYILAWDKSELPLFPGIREVEKVDWPANHRFFLIKDWIRENHYQEIGSFKYYYENEVLQQLVLFESPDQTIRLQVIILTDVSGVILDQIAFSSVNDNGDVITTDNVFMPYGGVYPDNWTMNRFPAVRKINLIAKHHMNAMVHNSDQCCVKFESEGKDWIIENQELLEKENVDAGILNRKRDRMEYGKMTGEGRYRIWKELLLLNYFSISSFGK